MRGSRFLALAVVMFVGFGVFHPQRSFAQSSQDAGKKLEFEVASVKQNRTTAAATSNLPLDNTDNLGPVTNRFTATGWTLAIYIAFAYKMDDYQEGFLANHMPEWAMTERFDIEALADGNPTKDELRQMMIALLADRFKLSLHRETQVKPVYWLEVVEPGKIGPHLQLHATSCEAGDKKPSGPAPWPATCGSMKGIMSPTSPGLLRIGGRDVTLAHIAEQMTGIGNLDRPVLDHTGLTGEYDFTIEFTPQYGRELPPGNPQFDENGPPFQQALKEQLELKLEPQKGLVEMFVIDHVEQPSPN